MPTQEVLDLIRKYVAPYRRQGLPAERVDPGDTCGLQLDKGDAAELLQDGHRVAGGDEQDLLYAQDRWSSPLVFQAMDAAGKDGTIKHVMSGVNVGAMVSLDLREARRREKKELSAGRAALFRKR
jgi:polyphosphate kinase 2 (PPK2 family)